MNGRVLDIFCGAAGGWSLGMSRAGYVTVAGCELDDWRRATFAASHPGCRMYADVRELSATRLLGDLGFLPDIIVGSPPCQDISAANTRGQGIDGARSGLFWEALRLVREIRPLWACLENSPRIRTLGYDALADELEAIGYATWPHVVEARHVGANHRRGRAWIIAADTNRSELWELSGRGGGADGRGAAVAGEPGADAHCVADQARLCPPGREGGTTPALDGAHSDGQGQYGLSGNGEVAGSLDGVAGHANGDALMPGSGVCAGSNSVAPRADLSRDDPDPHGRIENGARRHPDGCQCMGARENGEASSDPEQGGCEGRRQDQDRGSPAADLPSAIADIGRAWPDWNGGLTGLAASCAAAGVGGMDDGISSGMAPNLRNRCIAAYGDAVLPQIAEAIGRVMARMFE